eukprot:TRINITY_DN10406_c0_g1_i1.p1 TRINITY_DN10406_c0_g1~~TRINITY_DN10406_c0_g1_i1.p1  ORF type:complete len:238 (-),score=76.66 TRINITY_DN10406_c0_g1_i1:40-753(-)
MQQLTKVKNTIVLKLGGSFLLSSGSPNLESINEMANTCKSIINNGSKLIVVVGGGVPARNYIQAATALGSSNGVKDYFGILVSRLNARLFIEALGDEITHTDPAESLQQVRSSLQTKPIVVLGGLQPGQSTTAVAALCAEYVKADKIIFSTDVDGVFDSNPKTNKDAKLLNRINYDGLRRLTGTENSGPGQYQLMDGVCLTILERSKIPSVILKGTGQNILDAIEGKDVGTLIVEEK